MDIELKVPDIGEFSNVEIIDILIEPGQQIDAEEPLIILESDKASMEVPASQAGKITELKVKVGDKVSKGDVVCLIEGASTAEAKSSPKAEQTAANQQTGTPTTPTPKAATSTGRAAKHAEIMVLGAGPGGYSAAFRAADLGKKTILIDRQPTLGGVCLNVGCIPSKALLHAAKVISEADEMSTHGIGFAKPKIDIDKLRSWKDGIIGKLTDGLAAMAKARKVETIQACGKFISPNEIEAIAGDGAKTVITFDHAIIATGSEPITLPFVPHDDPRVIDSTGALELDGIPKRLLVLGGGIIGLEMACVYQTLGSKITVVELLDQLIPGADKDIVQPYMKRVQTLYENIYLKTKVTAIEATKKGLVVTFDGDQAPKTDIFDKVLVAVGRKPSGKLIDADKAGVIVDERGFIAADRQMRTNVEHIFAIGDMVGQPMLAHKAVHEGHVAAEAAAGHRSAFDAKIIPSVAYTDPEIAWAGITEHEAKAQKRDYGKGVFPWAASGRALSINRTEGMTKLIFDEQTKRLLGAGIVGPNAGDLIAEIALAIELGADAEDIGLTIHPHPTLSESVSMAAEMFLGTITDLIPPKKKSLF